MSAPPAAVLITDSAETDPAVATLDRVLEQGGVRVVREAAESAATTLQPGCVLVCTLAGAQAERVDDRTAPVMDAIRRASRLGIPVVAVRTATDSLWPPTSLGGNVRSIDLWAPEPDGGVVALLDAVRSYLPVAALAGVSAAAANVAAGPAVSASALATAGTARAPHATPPAPTASTPPSTGGYRSLTGIADWVVAALAVASLLSVFRVFTEMDVATVLHGISSHRPGLTLAFYAAYDQLRIFAYVKQAADVVAGALFLFWLARAHHNLPPLRAFAPKYTARGAVASFFIPFVNMVRPYDVLQELWRETDPDCDVENPIVVESGNSSRWINVWWCIALSSSVLGRLVSIAGFNHRNTTGSPADPATLLLLTYGRMAFELGAAVAFALAIGVVRRITLRQDLRATHIGRYSGSGAVPSKLPAYVRAAAVAACGLLFWQTQQAVQHPQAQWRVYHDPDRLFAADFPMPPRHLDYEPPGAPYRNRIYSTADPSGTYSVLVVTGGAIDGQSARDLYWALPRFARSIADRKRLVSVNYAVSQPDTAPMITLSGRDAAGRVTEARLMAGPSVVYEVIATHSADLPTEAATRFLNSFQLQ